MIVEWRRQCGESCSHALIPAVRARRRACADEGEGEFFEVLPGGFGDLA